MRNQGMKIWTLRHCMTYNSYSTLKLLGRIYLSFEKILVGLQSWALNELLGVEIFFGFAIFTVKEHQIGVQMHLVLIPWQKKNVDLGSIVNQAYFLNTLKRNIDFLLF